VSPCHRGPPWGHLTSFQAGLFSSGTTRVLLGTPGRGQEVTCQGGDIKGVTGRLALSPGVPWRGRHRCVTRGCHPVTLVRPDGRRHLVPRRWPMPSRPTAVSPPLSPTLPLKRADTCTPGPEPVAPGMWALATSSCSMAMSPCHRATEGLSPRSCHGFRNAFQNGTGGGGERGHCCCLGSVGVTVSPRAPVTGYPCPCVPMSLCPHSVSTRVTVSMCTHICVHPCPCVTLSLCPHARV